MDFIFLLFLWMHFACPCTFSYSIRKEHGYRTWILTWFLHVITIYLREIKNFSNCRFIRVKLSIIMIFWAIAAVGFKGDINTKQLIKALIQRRHLIKCKVPLLTPVAINKLTRKQTCVCGRQDRKRPGFGRSLFRFWWFIIYISLGESLISSNIHILR